MGECLMKYMIPFVFHGKEQYINVDYSEISDAYEAGFHILNLPFAPDAQQRLSYDPCLFQGSEFAGI